EHIASVGVPMLLSLPHFHKTRRSPIVRLCCCLTDRRCCRSSSGCASDSSKFGCLVNLLTLVGRAGGCGCGRSPCALNVANDFRRLAFGPGKSARSSRVILSLPLFCEEVWPCQCSGSGHESVGSR